MGCRGGVVDGGGVVGVSGGGDRQTHIYKKTTTIQQKQQKKEFTCGKLHISKEQNKLVYGKTLYGDGK